MYKINNSNKLRNNKIYKIYNNEIKKAIIINPKYSSDSQSFI